MDRFAVVVHSKTKGSTAARLDTWHATKDAAEYRARSLKTTTKVVPETELPEYASKLDWQSSWKDAFQPHACNFPPKGAT